MASIQSRIFTGLLRIASGYRSRSDRTSAQTAVNKSRAFTRLMTLPQLPGTRSIHADIPNLRATWHVGKHVRDDVRIVYFHGGAYTAGSVATHRHFTSMLAKLSHIPVLSVDYRLAPEHPFPAGFDDAIAAYQWAKEHGPVGKSEAQHIVIAGDSAGGGLSAAIAMQLRDAGQLLDGGLMLLSPWMDLTCSSGAEHRIGHLDAMLNADHARIMASLYAGTHDLTDPRLSPLYGDFAGLPPMFVAIGGREIVLDEVVHALEKARAAGVEVTLERNEEMFHVWPVMFHLVPEGRASLERMVDWLNWKFPA